MWLTGPFFKWMFEKQILRASKYFDPHDTLIKKLRLTSIYWRNSLSDISIGHKAIWGTIDFKMLVSKRNKQVKFHSLRKTEYLLLRQFTMTLRFHPLMGTQPFTNFCLTWLAYSLFNLHMIIHSFVFENHKTGSWESSASLPQWQAQFHHVNRDFKKATKPNCEMGILL